MSDLIIIDGITVWDIPHSDARIFVLQSRCMEEILSTESGVGDLFDNQSLVDGARFATFLDRLLAIHARDYQPIRHLLGGYIGVALVLAQRARISIPSLRGELSLAWTDTLEELTKSMPYPGPPSDAQL